MRTEANLFGDQRISTLAVKAAALVGRRSVVGRLRRIRGSRAHERRLSLAVRGVAGLATSREHRDKAECERDSRRIDREKKHFTVPPPAPRCAVLCAAPPLRIPKHPRNKGQPSAP